ncbi:MAG: hypothetical protein SGPRY_011935, partial [Prymnesium sp.]
DFYYEHPDVSAWPLPSVREWRAAHRVSVSDARTPKPVRTFMEAAFPPFLTAPLSAFPAPTPVQSQAWPIVLSGYDTIALASTGSGKTLAFVLPSLVHILAQPLLSAGEGPIALMLAPTRELALQIKAECDAYGAGAGVANTCVYGGVPKGPQLRDLQRGVELVIATPGRLLDFLEGGKTNLRRTSLLVCDEADRMLDLGFEPQLRGIADLLRPERQTLMFSATWPREVERLASEFTKQPIMVEVNNAADLTANESIEQRCAITTSTCTLLPYFNLLPSFLLLCLHHPLLPAALPPLASLLPPSTLCSLLCTPVTLRTPPSFASPLLVDPFFARAASRCATRRKSTVASFVCSLPCTTVSAASSSSARPSEAATSSAPSSSGEVWPLIVSMATRVSRRGTGC